MPGQKSTNTLSLRAVSGDWRRVQEREELPVERLAGWDDRDAVEEGLVGLAADSVPYHIDNDCAARMWGSVFKGSVDCERVMEHALSGFELDGDGVAEAFPLFVREYSANGLHVSGESGDGQKVPAVAAGHVADAAVVYGAVIKSYPACEVGHGLCACPIGVVLVPCDNTAMQRGFAEELIVPETDGAIEKLGGGCGECRVPEQVMESDADAPCSEGMEQNAAGVA